MNEARNEKGVERASHGPSQRLPSRETEADRPSGRAPLSSYTRNDQI